MTDTPQLCDLCGGPWSTAVYGCTDRPGALTRAAELDRHVYADLAVLDQELAERCADCAAGLYGVHHPGCGQAVCGVHDIPRNGCGCDDAALAEAERADRRDTSRRQPRLARLWTRPPPAFAWGGEIRRATP